MQILDLLQKLFRHTHMTRGFYICGWGPGRAVSVAKGIPQCFLQWDAQCALEVPSLSSEVLLFLSKDNSKSTYCTWSPACQGKPWRAQPIRQSRRRGMNASNDKGEHFLLPASPERYLTWTLQCPQHKITIPTYIYSKHVPVFKTSLYLAQPQ